MFFTHEELLVPFDDLRNTCTSFMLCYFFDELVTNECKYTLAIDDFPTPTSPRSTILAEYIGAFSSCLTLWLTGVGARALLNEAKS